MTNRSSKTPQTDSKDKKKGGRRSWATPDQEQWLREQVSSYVAAQSAGVKGLAEFWLGTFERWFEKWPEPAPTMLPPPNTQAGAENQSVPTLDTLIADNVRSRKLVSNWTSSNTQALTNHLHHPFSVSSSGTTTIREPARVQKRKQSSWISKARRPKSFSPHKSIRACTTKQS